MFEKSDEQNQHTLEKQNRMEKPLVSKGAGRILSWSSYLAIAMIVIGVLVIVIGQALQ